MMCGAHSYSLACSSSVDLMYNGQEACSWSVRAAPSLLPLRPLPRSPTEGKPIIKLQGKNHVTGDKKEGPFLSGGGHSDAAVQHMTYYPGTALTPELVRAQMQLQHMQDQFEEACARMPQYA